MCIYHLLADHFMISKKANGVTWINYSGVLTPMHRNNIGAGNENLIHNSKFQIETI